jgi:hypothetical protein
MGFDTLIFSRIDSIDKDKRRKDKNMEFIWEPEFEDE